MIDDRTLTTDESGFLDRLTALPGSYDGPDGVRPGPYGLSGFGEAASVARALQSWVDAPLVVSGTQFLFAAGFDYGELGALKLSSELAGAEVVTLGYASYEPNYQVPQDVLSPYIYASYLAYATGHGDALADAERAMTVLRDRLGPNVAVEQNPAKLLAWTLWNRVPLLLTSRAHVGLGDLVQRVFARVGRTLAISTGEHPLELLTGALEGRHQLGDDLVGLIVGPEDEELRLARDVLETRVAQVERLGLAAEDGRAAETSSETPAESSSKESSSKDGVAAGVDLAGAVGVEVKDVGARALALWYASLWVAAYLALLHDQPPGDNDVYAAVTQVAHP